MKREKPRKQTTEQPPIEKDDTWSAPESGQPPGGRDSPDPEAADASAERPGPKDEL